MLPLSVRQPCCREREPSDAEHGSAMKSGSTAPALQGSAAPNEGGCSCHGCDSRSLYRNFQHEFISNEFIRIDKATGLCYSF